MRAPMALIARLGKMLGSAGRQGVTSAIINASASALDLVSFAIVARILTPDHLGIFLIALSVGIVVERLGSPNFAQTFMRYAVRAIETRRAGDLRHILELALLCDFGLLALGIISGFVTATLVAPVGNTSIFAAVVVTVTFATLRLPLLAIAVPRAFGRHQAIMVALLVGALLKVVILGVVMLHGGGMLAIAVAFAVWRSVAAGGGLAITAAEARRHGALDTKRSSWRAFAERNEDFWPFTRTGAITVLPQAAVDFATPLIGALSGVATAGLYGLATKVAEAARIYTIPIGFVLYSEQCKAVEQGKLQRVWQQTVRACLSVGILTAIGAGLFVAAGDALVAAAFGTGYEAAVPAITWCVIAAVPYSMAFLIQFGLFSLGAANQVLRAESIAAILFLAIVIVVRTPSAEQAAIALAVSRVIALVASGLYFVSVLRQREKNTESARCGANDLVRRAKR
jgi:O-antigen/teichoic acid export membrane protein